MLEKIEEKINKYKNKFNHKTWGIIAYVAFGIAILYGMQMANMFKRQKQIVQDGYNKSMYELVNYVQNVEVLISKARVTTTPVESSKTYADIWRQSNLAKENLASLPVEQKAMSNASKFLAQVSDYSYTLMKQTISGKKITDEQYKMLKDINEKSEEITEVLNDIYKDLNSGRIKWDEVENKGNSELENEEQEGEVLSNISKISKTFTEYEGLIYDGAYSEHILEKEPVMIIGSKEVTEEEAKKKAQEILNKTKENVEIEYIKSKGESKGKLDVYTFEAKYKNVDEVSNIEITKKGGMLSLFIYDRSVDKKKLSPEECEKIGKEYLIEIGIDNMKATYYLETENMITINYAAVQNDIILYPDLVKVKIAMDNGEVCSVETTGYIFNHKERTDIVPKISMEEAKNVINKNIQIKSEAKAIIPTDSQNEVLTYEFKGEVNDKSFIIYINANTGEEENVLLIINTPGGTLTM